MTRDKRTYSDEPQDARSFTEAFDRFYSRFAPAYDAFVKWVPVWRRWLLHALPHIQGPRVLGVSFGTGWLMTQYAGRFEAHGVDLNPKMVALARKNLQQCGLHAWLHQGNVESLPYPNSHFDTVLCTMALSGFPHARAAMREMLRVLAPNGRLVLIDVNYPSQGNPLGCWLVALWKKAGDLIRDMPALLRESNLDVTDEEIGGFGSVHLYTARRQGGDRARDRSRWDAAG